MSVNFYHVIRIIPHINFFISQIDNDVEEKQTNRQESDKTEKILQKSSKHSLGFDIIIHIIFSYLISNHIRISYILQHETNLFQIVSLSSLHVLLYIKRASLETSFFQNRKVAWKISSHTKSAYKLFNLPWIWDMFMCLCWCLLRKCHHLLGTSLCNWNWQHISHRNFPLLFRPSWILFRFARNPDFPKFVQ